MTSSNCSFSVSRSPTKSSDGLVRPCCCTYRGLEGVYLLCLSNFERRKLGTGMVKIRKGFRWREHLRSFLHSGLSAGGLAVRVVLVVFAGRRPGRAVYARALSPAEPTLLLLAVADVQGLDGRRVAVFAHVV